MSTTDDPLALLSRALDQTGAIIARVRPEQATLPTPCRSWNVRTLVHHMVDEVQRFAQMIATGERGCSDGDVLGDDWAGAYRAAADSLLTAWRQSDAINLLTGGDSPASWALGQHTTEVIVHGWDIAKATGQSTDLDPELGQWALDWGLENTKPEYRGDEADGFHIGLEIPVPRDAPLYDRVAGFGGRNPY